jgi:hypothetical protein
MEKYLLMCFLPGYESYAHDSSLPGKRHKLGLGAYLGLGLRLTAEAAGYVGAGKVARNPTIFRTLGCTLRPYRNLCW